MFYKQETAKKKRKESIFIQDIIVQFKTTHFYEAKKKKNTFSNIFTKKLNCQNEEKWIKIEKIISRK